MPAGRPEIPIDINEVERLAAQGLAEYQICHCLGISQETLIKRKKKYTELAEAIKRGKSAGIKQVTNYLMDGAREGNTTAQIFYLKNRDPENWSDRKELTHQHSGDITINIAGTVDDGVGPGFSED